MNCDFLCGGRFDPFTLVAKGTVHFPETNMSHLKIEIGKMPLLFLNGLNWKQLDFWFASDDLFQMWNDSGHFWANFIASSKPLVEPF